MNDDLMRAIGRLESKMDSVEKNIAAHRTDSAASVSAAPLGTISGSVATNNIAQVTVSANASSQIAARHDGNSTAFTSFRIATVSWVDPRGKDA